MRAGNSQPVSPNDASGSKSRGVVLWRASEPPDFSALSLAERQSIEQACSYAKLMESPEAYNGCLLKEFTARGHSAGSQR